MPAVNDENTPTYDALSHQERADFEESILEQAREIAKARLMRAGTTINGKRDAERFLLDYLNGRPNEVFLCVMLDNRHQPIDTFELTGTIDGCSVYPREVVRSALMHNAAAIILAHNHPSGVSEPSSADKIITERLREALRLVDIRVLDHIVIGSEDDIYSFAEGGLL